MLKAVNIVKHYSDNIPVLNELSIEISPGEFVVIMGDSGSGKTTFLNCLCGIEKLCSGQVILNDSEINTLTTKQLQEVRLYDIGFIFQDCALIDNLTVLENVALSRLQYDKSAMERADLLLDKMGIRHVKDKYPSKVSGGEKQRVGIARALVNEPKILFADEPTASLNKTLAMEIMEILKGLNTEGHTILLVTHSHAVAAYCKRLLVLEEGVFKKDITLSDDISANVGIISHIGA